MNISISTIRSEAAVQEVVERKGMGHPDTLADGLGEELSSVYSKYTLKKFGYILHHDFDKVGILGGKSQVRFGEGSITKPITLLINCRASYSFGDEEIPLEDMLKDAARKFIFARYPTLKNNDITITYNVNPSSSPGNVNNYSKGGARKYWFNPRGPEDLPEVSTLNSNDSVIVCGYAPLSTTERICIEVEQYLNSDSYKKKNKWCGTDIKLQVTGEKKKSGITICVPQLASRVNDIDEYIDNLAKAKQDIKDYVSKNISQNIELEVNLNTRDNLKTPELYLTAIGSSIESGDIGMVGRGNRVNGLITPNRPMSIEAPYGKNPVYHVGKLYSVASHIIARKISDLIGGYCEVFILSQSGRLVKDPWKIVVKSSVRGKDPVIKKTVEEEIEDINKLTMQIIEGKINLVV